MHRVTAKTELAPVLFSRMLTDEEIEFVATKNKELYGTQDAGMLGWLEELGDWPSVMDEESARTYTKVITDNFIDGAIFEERDV